jgi:hypothetical protein
VSPHKFKTLVKTWIVSQIILFQETLEFKHTLPLIMEVNSPQVWVVAQIVVDTLGLVIQQCVLNQSQGYWFDFYALIVTISLICQMQLDYLTLEISEIQDFDDKFQVLQQCMQKKVVQVLNLFISFHL